MPNPKAVVLEFSGTTTDKHSQKTLWKPEKNNPTTDDKPMIAL